MNGDLAAEFRALVVERMKKVAPQIEQRAREILRREIESCETVQSLKSGQLRAEFGIENPSDIDAIVDKWANSLNVRVEVQKGKASLVLTAVDDLYFDVLFLPQASQEIDGGQLDWLRFLLLVGSQEIVFGAYLTMGNTIERQYSRTDGTIMRKNKNRSWRVPERFQGTIDSNFIKNLCEQLQTTMAQLMADELMRQ